MPLEQTLDMQTEDGQNVPITENENLLTKDWADIALVSNEVTTFGETLNNKEKEPETDVTTSTSLPTDFSSNSVIPSPI